MLRSYEHAHKYFVANLSRQLIRTPSSLDNFPPDTEANCRVAACEFISDLSNCLQLYVSVHELIGALILASFSVSLLSVQAKVGDVHSPDEPAPILRRRIGEDIRSDGMLKILRAPSCQSGVC